VAVDVALGVREERGRRAPRVRVDRSGADLHVQWDVACVAWPEPDLDESRSALHRIPANRKYDIHRVVKCGQRWVHAPSAAVIVERWAIVVRDGSLHTTPGVAVCECIAFRSGGIAARPGKNPCSANFCDDVNWALTRSVGVAVA
jgi:hypothetical protein